MVRVFRLIKILIGNTSRSCVVDFQRTRVIGNVTTIGSCFQLVLINKFAEISNKSNIIKSSLYRVSQDERSMLTKEYFFFIQMQVYLNEVCLVKKITYDVFENRTPLRPIPT